MLGRSPKIHSTSMSPVKLWMKSLPVVLGCPILGWLFLSLFFGIWAYPRPHVIFLITSALTAGFIGVLIHFVLYLVFGLPIFYFIYRRSAHSLWNRILLLSVVVTLSLITYAIVIHSSHSCATLNPSVFGAFILSLYATWSALCARRYKKKLENKI
jgi:hypothetical protein